MESIKNVQVFDFGDEPYQEWMKRNPKGFVLNTCRTKNSGYCVLHRSQCSHITIHAKTYSPDPFTTSGYIKICSNQLSYLTDWLGENRPTVQNPDYCTSCEPENEKLKAPQGKCTGYWTFFCNPARWEIDLFLKTHKKIDTYQVTEWQKESFSPGQLGVIRVGTDRRTKKQLGNRDRLEAGIYGIVEIKSGHQKRNDKPDKYWLDWSQKELEKPVVEIYYLENLIDSPILLSNLHLDDQIDDSYLLHGFQASSMPLTKRSFQRIMEITRKSTKIIESLDEELEPDTLNNILLLEQKYANAVPEIKEIISQRIERGYLANHIKHLNGYRCQICEALGQNPFSFRKKNGEFYVEAHHVIPLSERQVGSLSLLNLITVCANHHRQVHFGDVELIKQTETEFIFKIDENKISIMKTALNI